MPNDDHSPSAAESAVGDHAWRREIPEDLEQPMSSDILDTWAVVIPTDDFADRVLRAHKVSQGVGNVAKKVGSDADNERVQGRSRVSLRGLGGAKLAGAVVLVMACVAVAIIGLVPSSRVPAQSGTLRAVQRSSQPLGHRGVAVAEPGAALSWQIAANGAVAVEQSDGDVFYRVESGEPFVVRTRAGEIAVIGTCFQVEVNPMKVSKQVLVGAAVGAVLVVTVYEGRVLLANAQGQSEAAAGQRLVVQARGDALGAPRLVPESAQGAGDNRAAWAPANSATRADLLELAPPGDITREQLLARDQAHRETLTKLRTQVASLGQDLAAARRQAQRERAQREGDGRPWFDPSPETLRRFAEECRVRYDVPSVAGMEPTVIDARKAAELGMDSAERKSINRVLAEMHASWGRQIRAFYLEATGDVSGVESLSHFAMAQEIEAKSLPGERARVQKRLAQERAGLVATPTDVRHATVVERYFRRLNEIGDEMEALLAREIGADRARELRERNDGWGMDMEYAGCPDEE